MRGGREVKLRKEEKSIVPRRAAMYRRAAGVGWGRGGGGHSCRWHNWG